MGQNVKMRGNANREEGGLGGLGDPARVAWLVLGNTQVLGTGYWETPGYGVLGTGKHLVQAQPTLLVGRNRACNNDPACHANASKNIN